MTQGTTTEPLQVVVDRLNYFQALSQERKQGHPEYWAVQHAIDRAISTLTNCYGVDPILNPRTNIWSI